MSVNLNDTVTLLAQTYLNGIPTDPTFISLVVTKPDNSSQEYDYPTGNVQLVRLGTGQYSVAISASQVGTWRTEWHAAGADLDEATGSFVVVTSPVDVSVLIQDTSSSPIAGAHVEIFLPDKLTLLYAGATSATGIVNTSLMPGNYVVLVRKDYYRFPATNWTVTNTSQLVISAALQTMTQPDISARVCTIFGYVYNADSTPCRTTVVVDIVGKGRGAVVKSSVLSTTQQPNNAMIRGTKRELRTNMNGYWYCDVPWGTQVRVYYPQSNWEKVFTVPDNLLQLNVTDALDTIGQTSTSYATDNPSSEAFKGNS